MTNVNLQQQLLPQNRRFTLGQSPGMIGGQTITLEDLRRYFHLPIAEVARQFNTCTTALKKVCRKLNINKWPYRQILSLTKSIQSLEMAALNEALDEELRGQYRKQINILRKTIAEVVNNPSKIVVADSISKHADDEYVANPADTVVQVDPAPEKRGEDDPNVTQVIRAAAALLSRTNNGEKTKRKVSPGDGSDAGYQLDGSSSDDNLPKRLREETLVSSSLVAGATLPMSSAFPDIGNTTVRYNAQYENSKSQFVGPVHLAPLLRRKLRPNVTRKVVPLMEPDIGSHFHIEFTPQFIMSLLHRTLVEKHAMTPLAYPYSTPSTSTSSYQQQQQQQQQYGGVMAAPTGHVASSIQPVRQHQHSQSAPSSSAAGRPDDSRGTYHAMNTFKPVHHVGGVVHPHVHNNASDGSYASSIGPSSHGANGGSALHDIRNSMPISNVTQHRGALGPPVNGQGHYQHS